jgi:hypothetical protein
MKKPSVSSSVAVSHSISISLLDNVAVKDVSVTKVAGAGVLVERSVEFAVDAPSAY